MAGRVASSPLVMRRSFMATGGSVGNRSEARICRRGSSWLTGFTGLSFSRLGCSVVAPLVYRIDPADVHDLNEE